MLVGHARGYNRGERNVIALISIIFIKVCIHIQFELYDLVVVLSQHYNWKPGHIYRATCNISVNTKNRTAFFVSKPGTTVHLDLIAQLCSCFNKF